jgi:type III pantothenate kinase
METVRAGLDLRPARPLQSGRMPRAEFLLIDNSNSVTKLALASRHELGAVRKHPTADLSGPALHRLLRGWRFDAVVLSSVVPSNGDLIARTLDDWPLITVDAEAELGVGIDYPKPSTIGADRLANATAAAYFYGAPVVVVDFGTAVTFDIVGRSRCYSGGVIAPGLEAMTDYLHQRTALLPKITLQQPPSVIGKSTQNAMRAGAVFGYRGLVREILGEIRRELGARRLSVVATGGYAELIAAGVKEIDDVHCNLTLEGLRIIGGLNR